MALKHFGSGRGLWKDSEQLPEAFRDGQIETSAGNGFCPWNLKLDQSAPILKSHLRAKKSRCQPHRVISCKLPLHCCDPHLKMLKTDISGV